MSIMLYMMYALGQVFCSNDASQHHDGHVLAVRQSYPQQHAITGSHVESKMPCVLTVGLCTKHYAKLRLTGCCGC